MPFGFCFIYYVRADYGPWARYGQLGFLIQDVKHWHRAVHLMDTILFFVNVQSKATGLTATKWKIRCEKCLKGLLYFFFTKKKIKLSHRAHLCCLSLRMCECRRLQKRMIVNSINQTLGGPTTLFQLYIDVSFFEYQFWSRTLYSYYFTKTFSVHPILTQPCPRPFKVLIHLYVSCINHKNM